MKIKEDFINDILKYSYPNNYQYIYDNSKLLQYLDLKTKAIHGNSKSRRSLANIYAIYSILYFYQREFYKNIEEYCNFEGYEYNKLFLFYRRLYGGSKLQNHALNSRVNGEFKGKNKDKSGINNLIINNNGKYLIHVDYLYVDEFDISKVCCVIIEKYIELLKIKDNELLGVLEELENIIDYNKKRKRINNLLSEDTEARIFEIISYAILKYHYKDIPVYFGYSIESVHKEYLQLFKTGRTNANDGGIDFVMRPVGRFFQVTEVSNYDKYLLDIDKVMHFPVTFVIKTSKKKEVIFKEIEEYIDKHAKGMIIIKDRYNKAIEEIITINELQQWMFDVSNDGIDNIIRDIDSYYKLEMNIN